MDIALGVVLLLTGIVAICAIAVAHEKLEEWNILLVMVAIACLLFQGVVFYASGDGRRQKALERDLAKAGYRVVWPSSEQKVTTTTTELKLEKIAEEAKKPAEEPKKPEGKP
ncbi:MAG: hypothetical protein ABFE07_28380 [Armatimonadia bacterium]